GLAARHFRIEHDHADFHLFGDSGRPRRRPGCAGSVRLDPDGFDDCLESFCRDYHRRLWRRRRRDHRRPCDRCDRNVRRRLHFGAVQGRLCLPGPDPVPGLPAARHLRRTCGGESMSAPSDNMTIPTPVVRSKPLLLRHLPYFICAAILVGFAARMQFNGYVLNVLMQATTFSIAVFGLSVVLGLCGQINLAQAAFFGFGAYVVGIGTADLHMSYWLCLVAGALIALAAGALLGMSTLRLGGHYLAMVTISFQEIVTLVMVNDVGLTHGPDGVSNIGRPELFQSSQSYLAFCVAVLAIVGYLVWHLPDTKLGRAMRAVRDNELAAGVNGIDVFRTKIYAFAICAVLGGLAGGLFAGGFAYISPDQFTFNDSIVFLTMSLLGGVASPIGAAIGTGLLILIPEWLRFLKSIPGLYLAIYGLFVILIIGFMPD